MLRRWLIIFFVTLFIANDGLIANAQDAELKTVQSFLGERGYVLGEADGFMGPKTQAALIAFQNANDLPETGKVDAATQLKIAELRTREKAVATTTFPTTPAEEPASEKPFWWGSIFFLVMGWLIFSETKKKKERTRESNETSTKELYQEVSKKVDGTTIFESEHQGLLMRALEQTSVQYSAKPESVWIPKDSKHSKIGGMVYVGKPPLISKYGTSFSRYGDYARGYIDPFVSVARIGQDKAGETLPYWPNYKSISPIARATYLAWLASGRKDTSYNAGYMFLYFYGLERRFFVDNASDEQRKNILQEAKRLLVLYEENYSARNYLSTFVDVASLELRTSEVLEPILSSPGYDFPLSLAVALGTQIARGKPLSAEWAMSWFLCHPDRRLRTPAQRCKKEFQALFMSKFEKAYPQGFLINAPKRILTKIYRAASGDFEITVNPSSNGAPIPDISKLRGPIRKFQSIADEAMTELDKFSRYLGRYPKGRGTIEAQALLPEELWKNFPSEELEDLKVWSAKIIDHGGLIDIVELIEKLQGEGPQKITKKALTSAADALAQLGVGFAPDPRFSLRSPSIDDPVILFKLPSPTSRLEDVSDAYKRQLVVLALSVFIAQADGEIAAEEQDILVQTTANAVGLNESESARLIAELLWMLAVPVKLSALRKRLKEADSADRLEFRETIISVAHADGIIRPEEVAGIEKIYKILDIDSAEVYADLHGRTPSDEPVRVRAAIQGVPGEKIPDLPKQTTSKFPKLDVARIAAIQSDTAKAATVLGAIFSDAENDTTTVDVEEPEDTTNISGLDANHGAFVLEIVQRPLWQSDELPELARRFGLMLAGSIETINEWSIETFEDTLIEDYQGYEINQDIAKKLVN